MQQNQIQSRKSFCSAAESDPAQEVILQCCRMTSRTASSEAARQPVTPDHNLNVVHHNLNVVFKAGFQPPPIRKLLKPNEWRENPEMVRSVPYMAALVRK